MISIVSTLVQLIGFIAGIYLIFAEGFWIGVGVLGTLSATVVLSCFGFLHPLRFIGLSRTTGR